MSPSFHGHQRAFLASWRQGAFGRRAAAGLAQPTVRARVEALERSLGTGALHRSAQAPAHDQARALGEHARAMPTRRTPSCAQPAAPLERPRARSRARAAVVSEMVGMEVLPADAGGASRQAPGLVVELDLSNASATSPSRGGRRGADAPAQPRHPGRTPVGEVPLGIFAHVDYLAARALRVDRRPAGHDVIGPTRQPRLAGGSRRSCRRRARPDSCANEQHPAQLACCPRGPRHRRGAAALVSPIRASARASRVELASLPLWLVTHRSLRALPRVRATLDHLAQELPYCSRRGARQAERRPSTTTRDRLAAVGQDRRPRLLETGRLSR
jgi:hypothetical protein